jgi:hemerythrin-like domain-containing protein
MSEKKPMDVLEEEHRVIEKIIHAMTALTKNLEMDKAVAIGDLHNIAEFMGVFGDTCHHGKEEKELFPLLITKGVPEQGCPIAILTHEHEMGRELVKGLREATAAYEKKYASAKALLLKQLMGLTKLYPDHIWKEEYLLFPMANKILDENEQRELQAKFEMVEKEIGRDTHAKYEQLAEKTDKKFYPE